MSKSRIFALLIIINGFQVLFAQRYSFVQYSTEEGLPQSQVTSICQDDKGYLWVSTLGGLAKFNGDNFSTYSTGNGLLNNRVTTVNFFDDKIWVGHDGGLTIIHNNSLKPIAFTGEDKSRNVSKIIKFKGRIIVCSNGAGLFELRGNQLAKIDLDDDFLRVRDAQVFGDVIYFATKNGMLTTKDLTKFDLIPELGSISFSGVRANDELIIASSYSEGIFIRHHNASSWEKTSAEEVGITVTGCMLDDQNNIWLSSQSGIQMREYRSRVRTYDESNGLPVNMISCFYEDRDGYIWIGSQGKGLFRFPGTKFEYYNQSSGLPTDLFLGGFQKANGDYYLGTYSKGLIVRSAKGDVREVNTGKYYIWSSLEDVNGSDWFSTEASLIELKKNGAIIEYDQSSEIPGTKITALHRVGPNTMYIGGNEGVSIYENGVFTKLGPKDLDAMGTVRDFEEFKGKIYCSSNLGLFVSENKKDFYLYKDFNSVVYNIEKDELGNLWLGTEEGLYRIREEKIERIDLLDDPASNYINFINYRNGELYIGSNNGLFVIQSLGLEKPIINRFGRGDGLVELETNLNSGFFDNQGHFWFGTAAGLVCFFPDKIDFKETRPKINLLKVLIDYQEFDYDKYASEYDRQGLPADLSLPYSKNNLLFQIDGISLVNHGGLSYQFLLSGLNDQWSPLTSNSVITFTNLPAGNFILKVRSVDIDGRKSDIISFPFEIREAFYRTWWFITSSIIFILLLTFLGFQFRLKRIKEKNQRETLSYKARLLSLEQKSMNASMNRHFIFNALNSIQYFINTKDRISANKYLTDFAKLIRMNLDAVNNDGNTISLEEEINRIELYLSLESMRFKDQFKYTIEVTNVDTDSFEIPAMLLQPFVENSIIHGILPNEQREGVINIKIERIEDCLHILIIDNGIGVKHSMSKKGSFDGDHRSQGLEITSKRIELIKKLSDFDITLQGPEEIYGPNRSVNGTRVSIKMKMIDFDN